MPAVLFVVLIALNIMTPYSASGYAEGFHRDHDVVSALAELIPSGIYFGHLENSHKPCELQSFVVRYQGKVLRHMLRPKLSHSLQDQDNWGSDICSGTPSCYHYFAGYTQVRKVEHASNHLLVTINRPDPSLSGLSTTKQSAVLISLEQESIVVSIGETHGLGNHSNRVITCRFDR